MNGEQLQLPWKVATAQERGKKAEKPFAKKIGARIHPNSGAGSIQFDMSTDNDVVELKTAEKSFALNAKYLERIYQFAIQQGKEARIVIVFPNVTITAHITRTTK